MNSEDLELEMANYINEMAQTLLQKNISLPAGLEEKPYYGSQLTNVDDDPATGEYGEEASKKLRKLLRTRHRRRQLRAPVAISSIDGAEKFAEVLDRKNIAKVAGVKEGEKRMNSISKVTGALRSKFLEMKEASEAGSKLVRDA